MAERQAAIGGDRDAFIARFGGVAEHSPWVAAAVWEQAPPGSLVDLHAAFAATLLGASRAQQLAVLRAHPDLAVAGEQQTLTEASRGEQAGAGLDRLRVAEREALAARLTAYRERFGFPFIACVRDHGGAGLTDLLAARIGAEPEAELQTALGEVLRIMRHRLADLLQEPTR